MLLEETPTPCVKITIRTKTLRSLSFDLPRLCFNSLPQGCGIGYCPPAISQELIRKPSKRRIRTDDWGSNIHGGERVFSLRTSLSIVHLASLLSSVSELGEHPNSPWLNCSTKVGHPKRVRNHPKNIRSAFGGPLIYKLNRDLSFSIFGTTSQNIILMQSPSSLLFDDLTNARAPASEILRTSLTLWQSCTSSQSTFLDPE